MSDIKTPAVEQYECRPSPGRKAVEKFRNAPVASTEIPAVCPDCGFDDYEVSDVRNQQLREIQVKLNDSIEICFWSSATGAASIAAMCTTTICLQIRTCRPLPAVMTWTTHPMPSLHCES